MTPGATRPRGRRRSGVFHAPRARVHLALLAFAAVLAAAAAGAAYETRSLDRLEIATIDARFATVGGPPLRRDEVVVVGVDRKTAVALRMRGPLPRSLHAQMIGILRRAQARTIAYDLQFTEPTKVREDNALLDAADRHRPVAFATGEVGDNGETGVFGGDDVVRDVGALVGYSGLPRDSDGVSRRVRHTTSGLKAFSVVVAELVLGRRLPREPFEGGAWIAFQGPAGSFRTLSFIDVLRKPAVREQIRGKIVVVGYTDPLLQDAHPAPAAGGVDLPGPVIQATAIATALAGFPLRPAGRGLDLLLIVLCAAAGPLAAVRLRPSLMLAVAALAGIVLVAAAALAFRSGTAVALSYALMALVLGAVTAFALEFAAEVRERRRTRRAFSRFVPERVVEQAMKRRESDLRDGIHEVVATVMFTDLRGFTAFSERLAPAEVVEVLNRYLGEMSDAVVAHSGTVVDYMGDGMMAVFGAPTPFDDHADRALSAAREMLDERLPRFNEWLRSRGQSAEFAMGIGVNSGPVVSANVGSKTRVAYTAIGDTTNTAARLENMTKGSDRALFIAESTHLLLLDPPADLRLLGDFEVRGREDRVRIYTLADAGRSPAPRA